MAETDKGPDVKHRTIRGRALAIGTRPEGFTGGIDYDPVAGVPDKAEHYEELEPQVAPGKPSDSGRPFNLK